MRQNIKRRARNFAMRRTLRNAIKAFVALIKEGKTAEAATAYNDVQKACDMAAKKKIIHKNNAARKKSRYAKMLAGDSKKKAA